MSNSNKMDQYDTLVVTNSENVVIERTKYFNRRDLLADRDEFIRLGYTTDIVQSGNSSMPKSD